MNRKRIALKPILLALGLMLLAAFCFSVAIPGTAIAAEEEQDSVQALSDVTINATNFPDATFRKWVTDAYGENGILKGETRATTTSILSFYNYEGIKNLKGIEYFPNLTTLNTEGISSLEKLDLSKNTKLTELNIQYANMSSLDLKANTRLTRIYICIGSISSLDISACTKLKCINLYDTKITKLDLSNCAVLEEIYLDDCRLQYLDLSKIHSVKYIQCQANQLNSLVLGEQPNLTYLECGANNLLELDLSGCPALETVYCAENKLMKLDLSKQTKLNTVDCRDNKLTALDFSKNVLLEYCFCDYNSLTSLKVTECPKLLALECFGNSLTTLDVSKNPLLSTLRCQRNYLTSLNVSNNKNLTWLACYENQLMDLDVTACKKLYNLECYTNAFFIPDLRQNKLLEDVNVSDRYTVYATRNSKGSYVYDMTKLASCFESSRVSRLKGGAFNGNVLTTTKDISQVTFTYQICANCKVDFTVVFVNTTAPVCDSTYDSLEVEEGNIARFPVDFKGDQLTYQWMKSTDGGKTWTKSGSESATSNTLIFAAKASFNGYYFKCIATDNKGRTASTEPIQLIVVAATPSITTNPGGKRVEVGADVSYAVKAKGIGLTYQWQKSSDGGNVWVNCNSTGSNTTKMTLKTKMSFNGMLFRCVVTDAYGKVVISNAAKLVVVDPTAPQISAQPTSQSVEVGATASFQITATGGTLTYQWQKSSDGETWVNSGSTGAITEKLSMTAKISFNGLRFRCVVTDQDGKTTISNAAKLTVKESTVVTPPVVETAPVISVQPAAKSVQEGNSVSFQITATGDDPTYQWQKSSNGTSWTNCGSTGANTAKISMTAKISFNGLLFRCVVTDKNGKSVTSNSAKLTVKAAPVVEENGPEITSNPENTCVSVGEDVFFKVSATGEGLTYQWMKSTDDGKTWVKSGSTGATTATMKLTAKISFSGMRFKCVVTDANGKSAESGSALLEVTEEVDLGGPVITSQTVSKSASSGDTVSFAITADGTNMRYQWMKSEDGVNWVNCGSTGATTTTMKLTAKVSFNGLQFKCVVTDAKGRTAESSPVTLYVK